MTMLHVKKLNMLTSVPLSDSPTLVIRQIFAAVLKKWNKSILESHV